LSQGILRPANTSVKRHFVRRHSPPSAYFSLQGSQNIAVGKTRRKPDRRPRTSRANKWTCQCTITMLATHPDITAVEQRLNEISEPHGGYTDGWGTFGNVNPPEPP